jgi:hypothetical protein
VKNPKSCAKGASASGGEYLNPKFRFSESRQRKRNPEAGQIVNSNVENIQNRTRYDSLEFRILEFVSDFGFSA